MLCSRSSALPLGLAIGTFRSVQAFLEPLTDFVRYMPAVAFIPLVMVWVGIDEGAKIAMDMALAPRVQVGKRAPVRPAQQLVDRQADHANQQDAGEERPACRWRRSKRPRPWARAAAK